MTAAMEGLPSHDEWEALAREMTLRGESSPLIPEEQAWRAEREPWLWQRQGRWREERARKRREGEEAKRRDMMAEEERKQAAREDEKRQDGTRRIEEERARESAQMQKLEELSRRYEEGYKEQLELVAKRQARYKGLIGRRQELPKSPRKLAAPRSILVSSTQALRNVIHRPSPLRARGVKRFHVISQTEEYSNSKRRALEWKEGTPVWPSSLVRSNSPPPKPAEPAVNLSNVLQASANLPEAGATSSTSGASPPVFNFGPPKASQPTTDLNEAPPTTDPFPLVAAAAVEADPQKRSVPEPSSNPSALPESSTGSSAPIFNFNFGVTSKPTEKVDVSQLPSAPASMQDASLTQPLSKGIAERPLAGGKRVANAMTGGNADNQPKKNGGGPSAALNDTPSFSFGSFSQPQSPITTPSAPSFTFGAPSPGAKPPFSETFNFQFGGAATAPPVFGAPGAANIPDASPQSTPTASPNRKIRILRRRGR